MSFDEMLRRFFDSYQAPADTPRVEMRRGPFSWKAVPLEWNCAKKLAAAAGVAVRMVSGAGVVTLQYEPSDIPKEGA